MPVGDQPHCSAAPDRSGRADARRTRVIDAARLLFAERGFHATGIAEIAKRSGVMVGQIYRDFANKEAIVAAIADRGLSEFLDGIATHDAGAMSCQEEARTWIARFIACHDLEDARLFTEIMAESTRNARIAAIFRAIDARLRQGMADALSPFAAPGTTPERIAEVAETIITIGSGVFQRRLSGGGELPAGVFAGLLACIDDRIATLR